MTCATGTSSPRSASSAATRNRIHRRLPRLGAVAARPAVCEWVCKSLQWRAVMVCWRWVTSPTLTGLYAMTVKDATRGTADLKALVASDPDFVWALMRTALQEALEAKMTETVGAATDELFDAAER